MTVSVIIPAPLRKYVKNEKRIECDAASVEQVFANLRAQNKTLVDHVIDENGLVREFIRVFVNKKDISKQEGLTTTLVSGDVISIVPAFAGG